MEYVLLINNLIETSNSTLRELYLEYRDEFINRKERRKFINWRPNRDLSEEEKIYLNFCSSNIKKYKSAIIKGIYFIFE